jgi:hypothetical protein
MPIVSQLARATISNLYFDCTPCLALFPARPQRWTATAGLMSGIIVSYSGRPIPLIAFLSRGPHRIAPESPAARIGRLPKRCAFGSRQKVRPSPLNRALIPSTGCHAFWKADAHWSQKVSPTCAPLLSQNLYLSGQRSKTRLSIERKGLRPSAIPFWDTMPRRVPDGTPIRVISGVPPPLPSEARDRAAPRRPSS